MNAFQLIRPALAALVLGVAGLTGPNAEASKTEAPPQQVAAVEEHASHEHETTLGLETRFVTHIGCPYGWTGLYLVNVPGSTFLRCDGCGQFMTVYFPW